MTDIRGMIVPLITPLTEQYEVDFAGLREICEIQIQAGIRNLFALGTTGEFYGLTLRQRREVIETVRETCQDRAAVLAGISGESTAAALESIREFRHASPAGYVTSTPFFFDYTQKELIDHFRFLIDCAGQPLFLYNYPGRYRHRIEISSVALLLEEGGTCGIKDTAGELSYFRELLELRKSFPAFRVFEGALANLPLSAPLGADGSVQALGNLLPAECAELWKRAEGQDWQTLTVSVDRMWKFYQEMETVAIFISALKACMSLRGWCRGVAARPTHAVEGEGLARLRNFLDTSYPGWESS